MFIQENIVWKKPAISYRPICVKDTSMNIIKQYRQSSVQLLYMFFVHISHPVVNSLEPIMNMPYLIGLAA